MVMAEMHIKPGEAWEYCPRNTLRKVTKVLLDEFNVVTKPILMFIYLQEVYLSC